MTGYVFGEDYDIDPIMDAFGSEFQASSRDSTLTITAVLDTEYAESDAGGIPTMQRLARILMRTVDLRDPMVGPSIQQGRHLYQGSYEYTIREIMPEYGGLTLLICQVCYAPA